MSLRRTQSPTAASEDGGIFKQLGDDQRCLLTIKKILIIEGGTRDEG